MALRLRSGIFLPPHHPNDEDPTLALRRDIELIEYLDKLGYEEAWIGEHHSGGFEMISSPELIIAAAGERTKRIRLGTGVVSLPYHNPLTVADRIVQLDHMTMGRVMFGVGPGLLVLDAKMLGIDPTTTRDRMAEGLDVILRLLRGETVTEKTDWYTLNEAALHVLPFSDPMPEVAVASSKTPGGGRLAGKYGVGMICVVASATEGFDALATNWQIAEEIAAENGNTMDRSKLRLVAPIHIAETRAQAEANVMFGIEKWMDYHFKNTPAMQERTKGMSPLDIARKIRGGVVGTPDDVIALIERLQEKQGEFGCFLHSAHNWADWEQTKKSYELYARFVVPHIRKSNRSRVESLERFAANESEIRTAQTAAVSKMFDQHNRERQAKGKKTVELPTEVARKK